jgi:hypothetical protein
MVPNKNEKDADKEGKNSDKDDKDGDQDDNNYLQYSRCKMK